MNKRDAWAAWMRGRTPHEIGQDLHMSVNGVCGLIADVICAEYGGWGQVKAEPRLRMWARGMEMRMRTALKSPRGDWQILEDLRIGTATLTALKSFLAPERIRKRGPQIRGRRLAMLEACHRFGLGATRAARIANVSKSAAESVYRRIEAGKKLDLCGYCYIYHNDGTGLEEIKQCDE